MDTESFTEAVVESSPSAAESLSQALLPETPQSRFDAFTAEDVSKAREQEKQKLYPQLERLKDEVSNLRKERDDREADEARAKAQADADAKRRAEEDMDVRSLLAQKEQEWGQQLEAERTERERAIALLDQERQYQELQAWKVARVETERDNIMPELLDLVNGSSPDEIENSITSLRDRTARILDSAQQAMSSARRDMAGTRITTPAAGPLDTNSERQFTPDDISKMSMSDYQKYRERLIGAGASSSRGRGLFG